MNIEYENCPPDDAELFRIRGTVFSVSDRNALFKTPFITVRVESGRFIHIHKSDMQLFGVESLRKKKNTPKEFVATPEFIVTDYGDNHGMPCKRGYYALKPDQDVILSGETKFKCVEIIEE